MEQAWAFSLGRIKGFAICLNKKQDTLYKNTDTFSFKFNIYNRGTRN